MITRDGIRLVLNGTISKLEFSNLGHKITGKVRDCYVHGDKRILISSDRLSAFDVILTTIPYKGQILNDLAMFWFEKTSSLVPNHILSRPHPNVFIGQELQIVPIEIVVRAYLAGSAWRDYEAGKEISGIKLQNGLRRSEKLPELIITPSTKAEHGAHDMPISRAEILESNIVSEELYCEIEKSAFKLFSFASSEMEKRGLILVDTKYEFGLLKRADGSSQLMLADEVHTQDCSRYWIKETYHERFNSGQEPEMLDKEFVRSQLIKQGYMGEGPPPEISDEFRINIAIKYIEAYEKITGKDFIPSDKPINESDILNALDKK